MMQHFIFSYLCSCVCFSLSLSGIHCNESRKNSESNLFSRYPQEIFLILTNAAPKNKKIYLLPQKKEHLSEYRRISPFKIPCPFSAASLRNAIRLLFCLHCSVSSANTHKFFTMSSVFHQIVVLCKKTFHLLELLGVFSPADTMQRIAFSFYMLPF